jgi:hypothetical protein
MTRAILVRTGSAAASVASVICFLLVITAPRGRAQGDNGNDEATRIQQGFRVAPVPLNLSGLNQQQINLVGLGSYLVNAANDCNFCHAAGGPPNFNFEMGHNPYFLGQGPKKTDPTTYLAGGSDFFSALPFNVPPGTAYGSYVGPDIIARNLTPDIHKLPEGGHTLPQFMEILRTGVDLDKIHPTCTKSSPTIAPANCIPPPVDGSRLQIMPWPDFQDMTDRDIEAIWTYLSVIPCIDNKSSTPPAGAPNELRNAGCPSVH